MRRGVHVRWEDGMMRRGVYLPWCNRGYIAWYMPPTMGVTGYITWYMPPYHGGYCTYPGICLPYHPGYTRSAPSTVSRVHPADMGEL